MLQSNSGRKKSILKKRGLMDDKEKTDITKTEKPAFFERGKVIKIGVIALAVLTFAALIFNSGTDKKKKSGTNISEQEAANVQMPSNFQHERDNAKTTPYNGQTQKDEDDLSQTDYTYQYQMSPDMNPQDAYPYQYQNNYDTYSGAGGGVYDSPSSKAVESPLVPKIEGSFFNKNNTSTNSAQQNTQLTTSLENDYTISPPVNSISDFNSALAGASHNKNDYASQNDQSGKNDFYKGTGKGTIADGAYIQNDTIWTGTIISGVLISGINTDLPGDVLARVTQNVYDSRTGKHLLIPQGSTLIASYNSDISYAQSRVQIVWKTLTRPDGYQIDLDGMNSVDAKGFSGQDGYYHENWFQYAKAAGIIAMYSIANAKLAVAAGTASDSQYSNQQLMNQMASNVIERALNIQPTITVESGTEIKILSNRNVYLPPVPVPPVGGAYKRQ
jgi:type IV secretion system protein VirB10